MNRTVDEYESLEPFFSLWMERMTSEELFEKADIAFELARLHKHLSIVIDGCYDPCAGRDWWDDADNFIMSLHK